MDELLIVFSLFKASSKLFSEEEFLPLDPTQELIFPPELMVSEGNAGVVLEEFMGKWQEGCLLTNPLKGQLQPGNIHLLSSTQGLKNVGPMQRGEWNEGGGHIA